MKKSICWIVLFSTLSFAGDKITINSWGEYPIATGELLNQTVENGKKTKYLIPNNTKATIIQWNSSYTTLGNPYSKIDMWSKSQVKISNGPLQGKTLLVNHIYISLQ